MRKINVEKQNVKDWLTALADASRSEKDKNLWRRVHRLSAVPSRSRHSVNLYKINRYTSEGDNIVVPGKVLSEGSLDHKVNIAAIEFSRPALERIRDSNSSVVELKKMLKAGRVKIII